MAAVLFAPDSAQPFTEVEARALAVARVLRDREVTAGTRVLRRRCRGFDAGCSAGRLRTCPAGTGPGLLLRSVRS